MDSEDVAEKLEARLSEVDLLRRRVLNVIPHALRTTVTTFRGLANSLATASDEEIRTQITPALQRLAAQAEHLLDDMLIAAGISTALPTAPPVSTPVADTARAVWSSLAVAEPLEVSGDEDAVVCCPPGVLSKIFVHVLDNAAKHGAPPFAVDVRDDGPVVRFTVTDGGTISDGDAAVAFEPFYRGEAAVMAGPGVGVGLTVAKALVEQSNGTMALVREEGRTTVVWELPVP